jgi:protein TonB
MTAQANTGWLDDALVARLPRDAGGRPLADGAATGHPLPASPTRFGTILALVLAAHATLLAVDFGLTEAPGRMQRMAVQLLAVAAADTPVVRPSAVPATRPDQPTRPSQPVAATATADASAPDAAPLPDAAPALPAPAGSATADSTAQASEPAITEARVDTAYLDNPRPAYPPMSRRLGEQGTVILRVSVAADGHATAVDVDTSCGHERLDAAARAAVRQWRFIAARQGDSPVASTVRVPVTFTLAGGR